MPASGAKEERLQRELAQARQRIAELERRFSQPGAAAAPLPDAQASLGLLAQAIIAFTTPDDLAEIVLSFALEFSRSPHGFVGYLDGEGRLVCPTLTGGVWDQCRVADKSTVLAKPGGLLGWILEQRVTLLSNHPAADPRSQGPPPGHIPILRFLGVPALVGDRLLGLVAVANGLEDYTPQNEENLLALASLYALALERAGREADLQRRVSQRTSQLAAANQELAQQVEQARQAREELEAFFNTSPDLMAIAGDDGYFKRVNPAFGQTLGYSEQELLTRPRRDFLHPEDRPLCRTQGAAAFTPQGLSGLESRYICADGSVRWLSWSARPGSDLHTTYAVARDITARKRAEEALRQSEERLRAMVETAEEGILVYDAQGLITFVNRKMCQMTGRTPEEMVGRKILDMIDPQADEEARVQLGRRLAGERGSYELSLRLKDGDLHHWLIASSPLSDGQGRSTGAVALISDFTQRRQMEEELRKAQKLESLVVMAGGVAHDFNNLLQSILGNADLALLDLPPGSPAVHSILEVQAAGQRAALLAHKMLAFSGHTPFLPQSLDLGQFLRQILPELRRGLPAQVTLETQLPASLPPVDGDPVQLHQVLANLLTNAAEALAGRPGRISLSLREQPCGKSRLASTYVNDNLPAGDYQVIEVADDGPGMEPGITGRVFDPFFSTKFPGRGLGLAVALGVMRGHRGAVELESEPGEGTRVRLFLPTQDLLASLAAKEPSGPGPLVLVVDDDEMVLLMARRMLERHGYQVLGAADGWQGLRVLEEHRDQVRLALVDMIMPGPAGMEMVRRLRQVCSGLPVVLCSSHGREDVCAGAAPGELAGFLQKPFRMASLLGLVGRILEGDRAG